MAHVLHSGSVGSGLTAFVYGYSQGAHASPNGNVQGRCPRAPWVATVVGTVAAGWESNVYSSGIRNHIGFGSDMAHVLRFGSFGFGLTAFVYLHHQGAHASPNGSVQIHAPWGLKGSTHVWARCRPDGIRTFTMTESDFI